MSTTTLNDPRDEMHEKTFRAWVNKYLRHRDIRIDDNLIDGLKSGVNFILLVEMITGKAITQKYFRQPTMPVSALAALCFARSVCWLSCPLSPACSPAPHRLSDNKAEKQKQKRKKKKKAKFFTLADKPTTRSQIHAIENVSIGLACLRKARADFKIDVEPKAVASGNVKIVLGLVWQMILRCAVRSQPRCGEFDD